MPNPLSRTLRAYAVDARAAATSAPVEVALGLLLAITLSTEVRSGAFKEDDWARLAGSAVLAFPLVFSASVLRARGVIPSAVRWAATAGVLTACAAFGLLWFDTDRSAHGWRWFMLAAAAALVLGITSGIPRRGRDRRRSWAFAWRLAERLVGVALYSVALYGILAGAFAAVVNLFDLKQPQHLFTDLAGAVFFGVAPWIFVGGIHRLIAPPPDGVPVAVGRLGRWLYAPVLVIYLAILYAYALKVLATGELPKNLVSPLVIAAGMIGFVGAVLLEPVHGDDEHRGLSQLIRWMPALLLPLLPLAFWAVLERLGQHGWTEFRYLRVAILVVLAVLAVLGTVRLARRGPPLMSTIPVVLAAVLLLAAIGPWGALAVSRRDQTARLRAALAEAKVDPRRIPGDTVTLDSLLYARIDGGARYLLEAHGRRALTAVVPRLPKDASPWQMGRELGFRRGCGRDEAWHATAVQWRGGIPGVMGGVMVPVSADDGQATSVDLQGTAHRVMLAGERFSVAGAGWRAEASLAGLRRQAVAARKGDCDGWMRPPPELPPSAAVVPLPDAAGRVRGQLLLQSITVGGPRLADGTAQVGDTAAVVERTPPTPGTAVRQVRGYLVVAP
jgi:cytochrome bd-type quinol oxidase subunit 2